MSVGCARRGQLLAHTTVGPPLLVAAQVAQALAHRMAATSGAAGSAGGE